MSAQKGIAHAAASRLGHKAGRWLARTICGMPTVQSLLASNKEAATIVSEFVAGGTDAIEIPGDNFIIQLINRTIEATASESAELIAEFHKNTGDAKVEKAVIEAIEKQIDDALAMEVWLNGPNYVWVNCPHGFNKPQNAKTMKRGEAIMLDFTPTNCACHGTVLKDIPAAPKGKQSFIGILAELDQNNAEVKAFQGKVMMDKELRDKLVAAVESGISKDELMYIIARGNPAWSPLLGALVGEPDPLAKKWSERFSGFIEDTLARWDARMSREKDENERAAIRLHGWFDSLWQEENEETERRQPVRIRNGWKAFTIVLALAMAVGWGLYLIKHNQPQHPLTEESYNGR